MLIKKNWVASLVIAPVMLAASVPAHALFGDDEARKAILDLREKVEAAQNAQLMLQSQIEALREQNARLTGRIEELANQLTLEQRSNRDLYADLDKRMAELEPADIEVDGRTIRVSAEERRLYTQAVALFSQGKYEESEALLRTLTSNYPQTGYMPAALFWLGNSLYASGELKRALEVENKLLKEFPKDARVPDALLTKAAAEVSVPMRPRRFRKSLRNIRTRRLPRWLRSVSRASAIKRRNRKDCISATFFAGARDSCFVHLFAFHCVSDASKRFFRRTAEIQSQREPAKG